MLMTGLFMLTFFAGVAFGVVATVYVVRWSMVFD